VPTPISATECIPEDLVREVSPEAITFYVDELSGIYLPDSLKETHADVHSVKYWKPEDRLKGKFGRFSLRPKEGSDEEKALEDILVMGTTISLSGLDEFGRMKRLRHYALSLREILEERDLLGQVSIDAADYGSTLIQLDDNGVAESLGVGGYSVDFGRATAEGRQKTCDLFEQILGDEVQVINAEPEPRNSQRIIG